MPITINGSGTVTGISAGGLPDDSIVTADIANGAVTQAKRSEQLTLATAQNSTSGTSIDFTGIPSWVKRITVMLNGISTTGTSAYLLRVGTSSGIVSTGYASGATAQGLTNIVASGNNTTGLLFSPSPGAPSISGGILTLANISGNSWVFSFALGYTDAAYSGCGGGNVSLSGTLDRVRITTVNGTDTFDAGSINILYE